MPTPRLGAHPHRSRPLAVAVAMLLGLGGCAYYEDGSAYGYGPEAYGYGAAPYGGNVVVGGPVVAGSVYPSGGYYVGGGYPVWRHATPPRPAPVFRGGYHGGRWHRPAPPRFAWGGRPAHSPPHFHGRPPAALGPGALVGALTPRGPIRSAGPGPGHAWHGGPPAARPPVVPGGGGSFRHGAAPPPRGPGGGPPPRHRGGWRPDR